MSAPSALEGESRRNIIGVRKLRRARAHRTRSLVSKMSAARGAAVQASAQHGITLRRYRGLARNGCCDSFPTFRAMVLGFYTAPMAAGNHTMTLGQTGSLTVLLNRGPVHARGTRLQRLSERLRGNAMVVQVVVEGWREAPTRSKSRASSA